MANSDNPEIGSKITFYGYAPGDDKPHTGIIDSIQPDESGGEDDDIVVLEVDKDGNPVQWEGEDIYRTVYWAGGKYELVDGSYAV